MKKNWEDCCLIHTPLHKIASTTQLVVQATEKPPSKSIYRAAFSYFFFETGRFNIGPLHVHSSILVLSNLGDFKSTRLADYWLTDMTTWAISTSEAFEFCKYLLFWYGSKRFQFQISLLNQNELGFLTFIFDKNLLRLKGKKAPKMLPFGLN